MAPLSDSTRFICLFHSADRARAVVDALVNTGVARSSVQTVGDDDGAAARRGSDELKGLGVPDRDLHHLQDGLRHGGVVVSLEAPESQSHEIEKIFHRYSADKIDEADVQTDGRGLSDDVVPAAEAAAALPAADAYGSADPVAGETVIPVAQEELQVGKREVDRGGVRVFRRTVEEPVQQNVDLHSERVVLGYREVNRPVTDADLQAGNQEIELVETAEVPVVQKVARVVEEVRVGKVETDRTEVINDTVRHTEVEVEPVGTDERRLRD